MPVSRSSGTSEMKAVRTPLFAEQVGQDYLIGPEGVQP